jgi:hypothetical protein
MKLVNAIAVLFAVIVSIKVINNFSKVLSILFYPGFTSSFIYAEIAEQDGQAEIWNCH